MILYKGKKIFEGNELPYIPRGTRILVRPDPPRDQSEGGLVIPDIAQHRGKTGTIVAAGLEARDHMFDQGDQIGDRVMWGQLAGIWQEWDHIVEPGKDKKCSHEEWSRAPSTIDRTSAFKCDDCGAKRLQEPLLLMDVDDMQANEDLAARMQATETTVVNGVTNGGKTQHRYVFATQGGN